MKFFDFFTGLQSFQQDGNAQVEKIPSPTTLKMQGKH
jgi:hypothetical protein